MSPFGIATSLMGGSGEGLKKWTQSLPKTESKVTILGGGGTGSTMSRILLTSIVGRCHGKGQRWQDGSCTLRVIAGSWLGQVERTSNTETLEKWWSTCLEASEKNVRGCSHGTAMMIPKRAFLSRSSHSAFRSKWNSRSGRKFHSRIVKT